MGPGSAGLRSRQTSDERGHTLPAPGHDIRFPMLSVSELEEMAMARGDYPPVIEETAEDPSTPHEGAPPSQAVRDYEHEAERLGVDMGLVNSITGTGGGLEAPIAEVDSSGMHLGGLPTYQPNAVYHAHDYSAMDEFASQERVRLGLNSPTVPGMSSLASTSTGAELRRRLAQTQAEAAPGFHLKVNGDEGPTSADNGDPPTFDESGATTAASTFGRRRQRKFSSSKATPRRQGKLALFEGNVGVGGGGGTPQPSSLHHPSSSQSASHFVSFATNDIYHTPSTSFYRPPGSHAAPSTPGHDRPYRFSFYSNAQSATIHARSLCELPADGQTFEELFRGRKANSTRHSRVATPATVDSGGSTLR